MTDMRGECMKKKANAKGNQPKRHRYKSEHRLQNAWKMDEQLKMAENRIRLYAKYYGVNVETAASELKMLGYNLTKRDINAMEQSIKQKELRNKRKRQQEETVESDWDEELTFFAGYTSNGVPYRTKREDLKDGS